MRIETEEQTSSTDERDNESSHSVYESNISSNNNVLGAKWVDLQAIDYGDGTFESEAEIVAGKTVPRTKPNLGGTHRGALGYGLVPHEEEWTVATAA